jgi:hypothetical protein
MNTLWLNSRKRRATEFAVGLVCSISGSAIAFSSHTLSLNSYHQDTPWMGGIFVAVQKNAGTDNLVLHTFTTSPNDHEETVQTSNSATDMSETGQLHKFDPFYSTKEVGKGKLTVISEPDQGTTFEIKIPRKIDRKQARKLYKRPGDIT